VSAIRPGDRLALDLVSPLPPVRTGIADYTVDLLPHLEPLCDLRLVRVEGQEVAPEIEARWRPVTMDRLGEDGRVPFYQMGNNLHHERILEAALERPGLLTLHDLFLHHLLIERTLARGEIEPYREELTFDHGRQGAAVAEPPRWGAYGTACLFALPCHRRLVQRQRGVLVHSAWAQGAPARGDPRARGARGADADAARGGRRRARGRSSAQRGGEAALRHPGGGAGAGIVRFQTPIKRTDVAIAALARPELAGVHLLVVGAVAGELDLAAARRARRRRSPPRRGVRRARRPRRRDGGRRPLRQPALPHRRRDLGVAAAAARGGTPDAGIGLPPSSRSCRAIASRGCRSVTAKWRRWRRPRGRLLADRAALAALGRRAREHIRREHDPASAARRIVEACAELARRPPGIESAALPPPPSTLTWGVMGGSLEVDGAARPWPEGERRTLRLTVRNDGGTRWLAGTRGPGGVVFEVKLLQMTGEVGEGEATAHDELEGRPWPALPRDLEPGEQVALDLDLRRPLGRARLRIEPHVLGVAGASALAGAVWEAEL
jgi:hypothetical protein